MTFLLIAFIIVVAAIAFPFVVGPVLVYLIHTTPNRFEFFPLTDSDIESQTAPDFVSRSQAIQALGFEPVANLQSITEHLTTYTRIFHNFSTLERANVAEITANVTGDEQTPAVKSRYFEFATYFADGSEIDTNNGTLPGVFPQSAEKQIYSLPALEDAALLYAVHRQLTAGIDSDLRALPPSTLVEDDLQQECLAAMRRQVETGYMYQDKETLDFRPTVKGAILMAWKLQWPLGAIRTWIMKRKGTRLLGEAARA